LCEITTVPFIIIKTFPAFLESLTVRPGRAEMSNLTPRSNHFMILEKPRYQMEELFSPVETANQGNV